MSNITIYHNPACGTSRNVLALIRNSGEEPTVIEYLKTPPDRDAGQADRRDGRAGARDVLREKGTPYAELGLGDPKWSDDQLIDFAPASDPHQPAHRGHAAGHAPVPALGSRAGHPAAAAARRVQQGRRRAGGRCGGRRV
jgi:arsenate reductase (glutaredoxin)